MRKCIESSGSGIMPWLLAIAFAIAAPTTLLARGPGNGGGGGGKVSVTLATPSEASQGEELDVIIDGSGFDDGSTATWYLTGTSDNSQVQVLSNEYLPATGQLKARIRVNGNAAISDYDIEVQNSGGRRGKGTTLFKVKSVEVACTGLEDPEPSIAYLSEMYTVGDVNTWDLRLSSASGCDQSLLLEAAREIIPASKSPDGEHIFISEVDSLNIRTDAGHGLVAWVEPSRTPTEVRGIEFTYDALGQVTPATANPVVLYTSPVDRPASSMDLARSPAGEFELVLNAYTYDSQITIWWLWTVNLSNGVGQELMDSQRCQLTDPDGNCFVKGTGLWGRDTDEIYVRTATDGYADYLTARLQRVSGTWQDPEPVIFLAPEHFQMRMPSHVSAGGLATGNTIRETLNKRGKSTGQVQEFWIIDADACTPASPCVSGQGLLLDESIGNWDSAKWTANERLILSVPDSGSSYRMIEYDPLSGTTRDLEIRDVFYNDFAVSR